MLWYRQAIFESTLPSSAECRIRPGSQTPYRQQTECHWQTDWAIEDQAKKKPSATIQPTRPTASWLSHLTLAIYIFVIKFDVLAQAGDSHTHIHAYTYIHTYVHTHVRICTSIQPPIHTPTHVYALCTDTGEWFRDQDTQLGFSDTYSPSDWMSAHKLIEQSRTSSQIDPVGDW